MLKTRIFISIATSFGLIFAEFNLAQASTIYKEPAVPFFKGMAETWYIEDDNNKPSSIGITFTADSLIDLPTDFSHTMGNDSVGHMGTLPHLLPNEHSLSWPVEAAVTPFNHLGINWNPQGHLPYGVYDVPHFDWHFYLIDQAKRQEITVMGDNLSKVYQQPNPALLAPGYFLSSTQGGVPTEGNHAVDLTAPEFKGEPFTKTFIYGFYEGTQIFWEPMITLDYFKTIPYVTVPITQPKAYPVAGYYPTHYSIKYDANEDTYTVSLDGLTFQSSVIPEPSMNVGLFIFGMTILVNLLLRKI